MIPGPAVVTGIWKDQAVFWIGPVIGAIFAGVFYHLVLSPKKMSNRDGYDVTIGSETLKMAENKV